MRLSNDTLAAAQAKTPCYDRNGVGIGIVHLGIGAFHRAHQAVYTDSLLGEAGGDWAIRGVSLRSPGVRDALKPQDYLYTLAQLGPNESGLRVIGAVRDILVAREDPGAVLRALAEPGVRVVSLTITEKGYCGDPAQGTLDLDHPDISADLKTPAAPRSAIGLIVRALAARREASRGQPFTVMSCDNLPANGKTTKRLVLAFAEAVDGALAGWIGDHVSFPSTMVDRIVPAMTDDLREVVARELGLEDAWPVAAEPFSQWVVEDDFCAGRPAWERVGAALVKDAAPYEAMKLQLINGSHSTLAYLGYLCGHETIDVVMGDQTLVRFAQKMLDEEVTPSLQAPDGVDLDAYKAAIWERYRNPALAHRTHQIAMDGSQKLPQRLLASARAQLVLGGSVTHLALAVASWIRYAMGVDEQGKVIDVKDPLVARFQFINERAGRDPKKLVSGYLSLTEVFGDDLPNQDRFTVQIESALGNMLTNGAHATVAEMID